MIDSFHSAGNSSLFQIELVSVRISERIVLSLLESFLLGFHQYIVICLFNFSIAISTSKALDSGTSGSAECIYVCLKSLTPCIFSR